MTDDRKRTSVLRQLAALRTMSAEEIKDKWRDLYGSEPPRCRKSFLEKRLAYRIQELFYGGIDDTTKRKLKEMAKQDSAANLTGNESISQPNGRILPGTRFIRQWRGLTYETIAREKGFEYNGQIYRSLTALATAITGTKWNGRKWWGLPQIDSKKKGLSNDGEDNKEMCDIHPKKRGRRARTRIQQSGCPARLR